MTFSVSNAFVYLPPLSIITTLLLLNTSPAVSPEKINLITRGKPQMEKLCVIWLYQLARGKKEREKKVSEMFSTAQQCGTRCWPLYFPVPAWHTVDLRPATSIRWSLQAGGRDLHTPITTPLPLPAVTLCCILNLHFLHHHGKKKKEKEKVTDFIRPTTPASPFVDWDIKWSCLTAGNSHRKWGCTTLLRVPLHVIYLDGFLSSLSLFFSWESPSLHHSWSPREWMSGSWRSKPCSVM